MRGAATSYAPRYTRGGILLRRGPLSRYAGSSLIVAEFLRDAGGIFRHRGKDEMVWMGRKGGKVVSNLFKRFFFPMEIHGV